MIWRALAAALVCGLVIAAPQGQAAEYPTRAIKIVVPYPAGGPTDVAARMVGEYLSRDLKQSVVIENKGGAQGAIGADAVAHADADGYTLLFTASSVLELNPILYKKLSYDPDKDLRVLGIVTAPPGVMVVHPTIPVKSVAEFVAYAKKNPGRLNFGSAGTGGVGHLSGEMFKLMAGIEMTHVPYKGAGPALADLISGHIDLTYETLGTALPPINAGLVRPLGVTSPERMAALPNVPTIAESGYPDYRAIVWYGAAAPASVPAEIADIIRTSINRALDDKEFRAALDKIGFPPLRARSQAEIDQFVATDRAGWARVIKALNISLD